LFGPRICIFVSTIVLALGSLVAGVANTFGAFVFGRCVTGVGASGVFTISIIIVLELTGSERRGLAIGVLNSGYTFGVAMGATAAGALLPHVGWRALFWMQAPIALVGGTVLLLAIPSDFHAGTKDDASDASKSTLKRLAQLDYLGALTLTTSVVLLLYSLSASRTIPLLPILLSGVVLVTFVLNEVYLAADPIIPVALLKSRGLLLTCFGTVGFMMSRWSVLFYAPTYALAVRQWSPATAGSILIPTNAGFAIGGLAVGWLHIRRQGSFWLATVIVYAGFPVTLVILAGISTEHSSPALFVAVIFACGAFVGAALNYSLAHLLHLTPKSTHYVASSLLAMFRSFAGSFGSSIGGGLFIRTLYQSLTAGFEKAGLRHKEELVRRLLGSPALVENLGGVEKEVAIQGYQDALRMLFLASAGLAGLMIILQAGTGWTAPSGETQDEVEHEQPLNDERQEVQSDRDRA
jgi:predicted MFS family arabinose efflux permease